MKNKDSIVIVVQNKVMELGKNQDRYGGFLLVLDSNIILRIGSVDRRSHTKI